MKYAVLYNNYFNLGDDIQSIAAEQFCPNRDLLVNREKISEVHEEERHKIVLNGWFKHDRSDWPPAAALDPLITSFHLTSKNRKTPLDYLQLKSIFSQPFHEKVANYLQAHEPIGCRDLHTLKILEQMTIKAYFSGCLSLTLKNPLINAARKNIVLVDPFSVMPFANYFQARQLIKLLGNDGVIQTTHNTWSNDFLARRIRANTLLDIYRQAKLVITSRLHVALPCLAFSTPVIMINTNHRPERFRGYEDLLCMLTKRELYQKLTEGLEPLRILAQDFPNQEKLHHLSSRLEIQVQRFMANQTTVQTNASSLG